MVRIFEKHHQVGNITNYQSRVVYFDNFEEYLNKLNETSLPQKDSIEIEEKNIDYEKEVVTFYFRHEKGNEWFDFIHYAQVIE